MFNKHTATKSLAAIVSSLLILGAPLQASASQFTRQYTTYRVLPANGIHVWRYNCPSGQSVVSGGFDTIDNASYSSAGLMLTESYPSAQNQWQWRFINKGPKQAQYRLVYVCATSP